MEQQDILSMTLPELQAAIQELSEPKFRAKQIFNWLHQKRVTDFSEMTTLSLPFRERLASDFCINRLKIAKRLASSVDDTVKYLYELPDGNYVETVCIAVSPRHKPVHFNTGGLPDGMSVLCICHCRIRAELDTSRNAPADLRNGTSTELQNLQFGADGHRRTTG